MRHGSCGVIEGLKAILLDQAANADIAITGEMKKMFRHTARVKAARINQSIAADEEITALNKIGRDFYDFLTEIEHAPKGGPHPPLITQY